MGVIYLQHPVHGCKVACGEYEAKADEREGWLRYVPSEAVSEPEQQEEEPTEPDEPVFDPPLPEFLNALTTITLPEEEPALIEAPKRGGRKLKSE